MDDGGPARYIRPKGRILAKHVVQREAEREGRHSSTRTTIFGRDFLGAVQKKCWRVPAGTAKVIIGSRPMISPTRHLISQLNQSFRSPVRTFSIISRPARPSSQSIRKGGPNSAGSRLQTVCRRDLPDVRFSVPAGFENAAGIVAIRYAKEAGPRALGKRMPTPWRSREIAQEISADRRSRQHHRVSRAYGQVWSRWLKSCARCGDDLTRRQRAEAGVEPQRLSFAVSSSMASPTATRPTTYTPMKTLYISIFDGKDWQISDQPVTE